MIRISDAEFDRAVEQALKSIPREFQRYLANVIIEVCPRPTRAMMIDAGMEDVPADEILGMYVGRALEDQLLDGPELPLPDRVLIFRDNLCALCDSPEELQEEIRVTVLHEIGHHFGMDEDQLEELGYD